MNDNTRNALQKIASEVTTVAAELKLQLPRHKLGKAGRRKFVFVNFMTAALFSIHRATALGFEASQEYQPRHGHPETGGIDDTLRLRSELLGHLTVATFERRPGYHSLEWKDGNYYYNNALYRVTAIAESVSTWRFANREYLFSLQNNHVLRRIRTERNTHTHGRDPTKPRTVSYDDFAAALRVILDTFQAWVKDGQSKPDQAKE